MQIWEAHGPLILIFSGYMYSYTITYESSKWSVCGYPSVRLDKMSAVPVIALEY